MDYFQYREDTLFCDDVSIVDIASQLETPFYLYSSRTLLRHVENLHRAFGDTPHLTCYSVKANGNLALLHLLARRDIGADIVSGGELYRARRAGFPPERIVYSGVGKTEAEIRYGLREEILAFNVESLGELDLLDRIAGEMGVQAPIAFRVNPDVDPKSHPYISTGLKENKFGITHTQILEAYRRAREKPNIRIVGIDAHIGSQITEMGPFRESAEKLADLVFQLRDMDIQLEYVDIGGGLGIRYRDEDAPEPADWVDAVRPALARTGCRILFEPGRSMVGNAGILVTKVLYVKRSEGKIFVIVDASMTDLIRPSLYDAYHEILPVVRSDREEIVADIVGPVCESGDFLAKDRALSSVRSGDLLAVMSAGAYGFVMGSNYNARPRPAELLTTGNRFEVIRERETYEDLIRGERVVEV